MREDLKSPEKTLSFYTGMVRNKALDPLIQIFKRLEDPAVLQRIGCVHAITDLPIKASPETVQGIVQEETEFASHVLKYALTLVAVRLRSLLWHLEGLPGAYCVLFCMIDAAANCGAADPIIVFSCEFWTNI